MAKANNYKNNVFENIDFVVIYYCSIRELNQIKILF